MSDPTPNIHTLSLQFDAKQLTQVLLFDFTCNDQPAITKVGPYTGCYQFKGNDQLHIDITMTNISTDALGRVISFYGEDIDIISIDGFTINSLDLLSQPNVKDMIMPLSPFDIELASKTLPATNWSKPVPAASDNSDTIQRFVSHLNEDQLLNIVDRKGFWKVSGFLSVNILVTISGGEQLAIPRTFSFDPEMESGGRNP